MERKARAKANQERAKAARKEERNEKAKAARKEKAKAARKARARAEPKESPKAKAVKVTEMEVRIINTMASNLTARLEKLGGGNGHGMSGVRQDKTTRRRRSQKPEPHQERNVLVSYVSDMWQVTIPILPVVARDLAKPVIAAPLTTPCRCPVLTTS